MTDDQAPQPASDSGKDNGNGNNGTPAIADDFVLPFQTVNSNISGRIVRLGPSLDGILNRHDYPDAVGEALGQAVALTSLLGSALKFDGRLIMQTKTDGPLDLLVVNYDTPGNLRGYANFDANRLAKEVEAHKNNPDSANLQPRALGQGYLAMTIDPNGDMDRYQGIVALENETLTSAALTYFRQSEQLPTFIRLAVARVYEPTPAGGNSPGSKDGWTWRAGGLLLQHIAHEGGASTPEREGEPIPLAGEDDDAWQRTEILAGTVEDHELIDPHLSPERLLYRLFHEEGVRVNDPHPLADRCTCSRERVGRFLRGFAKSGLDDLRNEDGTINVTCEFCSKKYDFESGSGE
ncbi:MAG: Hsp33 family molecular chaperone [Alphaproteobacteria bacterium]|nr:Hsp33 family molecular chaperone [Alphaproteobacteria bacterium]